MVLENKQGLIKRNLPVILAFAIPVIILSVIFICEEVYPFGQEMYMRSDSYHQYLPFMRQLQRVLQEGGSLDYTWNIGLGSNFASTYAYYLASPLNWVIALFSAKTVPMAMDIFIVLKAGLMGGTFTYYLTRHFGRNTYLASVFGIFYALSAYMAAFSWNLMWLDCLVLLPLIMLGLEELFKHKRVKLYTITTAIAILSNYYIGIMLAIFIVFYSLYLLIFEPGAEKRKAKDVLMSIVRVIWYSILAGLMAMCVCLPAVYALFGTASSDFDFPQTFSFYNDLLAVLSKGSFVTEPAVFSGHFPNIFCTCAAFVLVPLFWINKRIKLRRKIGLTLLIAFFIFCFNSNIPTYIWHGLHFPNGLPCRQSFIFIALVLLISYEAVLRIKDYKGAQIYVVGILGIIANAVFYLLYKDEDFTLLSGATTAGIIVIYSILFALWQKGKLKRTAAIVVMLLICIAETSINSAVTGYSTAGYDYYTKDNDAINLLLNRIDDDSFYRVEKTDRNTKNDGTWLNYKSASIFNSTSLSGLSDFYEAFGMQASMNAFSYYGHTPLTTMLLGVKYEISKYPVMDELMTMIDQTTYSSDRDDVYLYENEYVLGLGYAVNKGIDETFEYDMDNPFVTQNNFVYQSTGVVNLFTITGHIYGEEASGGFATEGRGFLYITNEAEEANVIIYRDGSEYKNETFDDLENPQIIDLDDVKEGDVVYVTATDEDGEAVEIDAILATMDYDKLEDVYNELSKSQLNIEEFDNGYVKGTVDIEDGKSLFTTIPADEGWEVYVDGIKTDITKFKDTFIMLDLTPGTHEIEFKFTVPGRKLGVIIALAALILFIISLIIRGRKFKGGLPRRALLAEGDNISDDPEFWTVKKKRKRLKKPLEDEFIEDKEEAEKILSEGEDVLSEPENEDVLSEPENVEEMPKKPRDRKIMQTDSSKIEISIKNEKL